MTNSSWKVSSWTTPTTTVSVPPVPSEVSPESKSQISLSVAGQFASFIQENYPTFISFVKEYYKSQELKGYCFDVIQNWSDYYNIDNYGGLVTETKLISAVSTTSTTVDVETTRDFPNEGLLLINDEIIYYQKKGSTLFQDCARGFNAVKAVGEVGTYNFEETTAAAHAQGDKVVNLNNIFPLYVLGKFKEQFLATFPKNFASGVTESTVIKRIKDFYASKGSTRSFQFVLRTLFGVESEVNYPRDRIFKPSDAYYTSREVIRAVAVKGDPIALVGQVLYQENDASDPNVAAARIYVKGVVEVFTASGTIFEIDVDTNNSLGSFVTPYKSTLSADLGGQLTDQVVTVDSTLGWPEQNGRFRIEDEIITYTDKTVTQFLGCVRARESSLAVAHDAGQEVFAAFKIYGYSNVDNSEIQLKVYGGTRGVVLTDGGKYYLPDSKVTTPAAPGFDSIDPIWDSFTYNVRRALRGESATLGTVNPNGSVRCTVKTKEKHRLKRDDVIRILNAPEDIYNNMHDVEGIVNDYEFEFIFSSTPSGGISGLEFYIAREFAYGTSDYNSINVAVKDYTADVQNTYKSSTDAIISSTGVPSHKIGPFGAGDLNPGNQRYLKRIPLTPSTKSTKTATPVGQVGIASNGVPFFSYKGDSKKKFGGLKSITKNNGGAGYDITNPPTVEFEADYKLNTTYASGIRVKYNGNRYRSINAGLSSNTSYPIHTTGTVTIGQVTWEYEGTPASATVSVKGSVTAINVTNGGSGYTTEPIISITGGGATSDNQASASAQITSGTVTGINVVQGGSGYTSVPTITITGGNGSGATATATCRGPVDTIDISDAGSQYTYEPTIKLISGSGAVAYPSILNGKIESIIVTFGGSGYFGAPDVTITGDGVGATAFAQVDLSSNIVTGIVITNKGAGYSAGATTVSIVYPGTGAQFQTNLTELTFNEAASYQELGVPSNQFTNRKTVDTANGAVVKGENYLIYQGEYGYLYNPKMLRFLLRDNIDENLNELNPTSHSPILGWSYDGHPIYGPYGFEDAENTAPYNSYKLMVSSYNVKTSRDALLSGLTDPMGTYIEDYEYTEGYGDLDQYNGRFCVTPEYPNGIYAYFSTIKGSAGEPKFPYFVGPNFYSEADAVNWNGNGLQKNFTEDAIRYKAPFIGTDNIVAKRKQLDNRIDFFLALEDTTTLIVMETGEVLTYLEDGIGYFSYYPVIRGGTADSMVVSSTNKYSSAGVDQYLVEGGGKEYKVNDRLQFDNTGTGGEGVSAVVSAVAGGTVSLLANSVGANNDVFSTTITTLDNHYLQVGDIATISVSNNLYTREINVKVIGDKYHFEYFDDTTMKLISEYANTTAYTEGDLIYVANRVYKAAASGTSSSAAPTHETGTVTDGSMNWTYIRKRTDGNLVQGGWSSITGGSNYNNGTYTGVPLSTNGSGSGALANIVVAGGAVTNVTITSSGTSYNVGDTISASNLNLGNASSPAGSGFTITLTEVETEAEVHTNVAHQLQNGDIVNISGMTPTEYNKTDYTVIRSETSRRFTVKRNFGTIASANTTLSKVYVQEPKLQLIDGHKYVFDTSDTSNVGKTLAFTLDSANTDIFTYKNISDEVRDPITGDQTSITVFATGLPGIFYYFDIKGNVSGSYFTSIDDPVKGAQVVSSKTDKTYTFVTALQPESGYSAGVSYNSNSIYPSGGISTITIGDPGRNYSSLPKLSGSTRSGSGATAVATISGSLSNVSVTNQGSGYNQSSLPTGVVTLPDYVDLTLTSVFGSFIPNEIVISETTQGNQTARGQVISWNPVNSVLRVKPLKNERVGAGNKGYIMFSTGTAQTNNVYSADSQGVISAISGDQATVATVVSGGGALSEVTVTAAGSNYRAAPSIIFDDPYYGSVDTITSIVQPAGNGTYTADTTTTGVTQTSVAPVNGTGATFTVATDGNGRISTITVTAGGSTYSLGDVITFDGTKIPGGASNEDFTVTVNGLAHANPATIATLLDASVDTISVTNTGSGYLSAPNIEVSGGNGINAKFNATILNEGVSNINIETGGIQYQSAPVVNITQKTGSGASILLKSSNMGEILKIGGDNITFNYSHDRTLKPELNTTYNLQLTRTQVLDYFTITSGGSNFVSVPEIVLEGGSGSLYETKANIENEVIQSIEIINAGRGFLAAPTVKAQVTHTWVGLQSSSTLNFPYNTKIPSGTKVTLEQITGQFPTPLAPNTTYYAIAATTANGLGDNQIRLASSLANANTETYISFTGSPVGDQLTGQTYFTCLTSDLGDNITAFMKPATFSVGERIYQGASTSSYTAYGYVKNWDASGRVVSVEIIEGEFKVGEPVFGEETAAFGQIHAFTRADAVFEVSPISISATTWERTTGFLDLNEQRLYDSDRYQEFSYDIASSININDWKNPLKFAAHPAGFKVVGTQVLSQASLKDYRTKPVLNLNAGNSFDWWVPTTNSLQTTFNGTTYVIPKPSAKAVGKLSQIQNFALGKADYSAAVPTEIQVFGKQLLDIQKILSCISYKMDDVSDRSLAFDGSSSSIVNVSDDRITVTNHNLVEDQRIIYNSGGDRFQDARDLIIKNIDYIIEETIGFLNATYPSLTYNSATCARDIRLVLAAWANDLRYGGNWFTLDATNAYVGAVVSQGNAYIDAANLIKDNMKFIASEAVYQMLQDPTVGIASGYPGVPGHNDNCIDDLVDGMEAIAYNLRYGGNSETWDAANFYVDGVYSNPAPVDGEETQAIWCFNKCKELCAQAIINDPITIQGNHGLTQVTNTSPTYIASTCATVDAAMDTLFNIVTTALSSNSLATVTRTNPSNHILHIEGEETETIYAFNKARDLCNLAVVNNLPSGTYTSRNPIVDLSITAPADSCATVTSAITSFAKIITDGIDNPSTLPNPDTGNYPLVRTGTPITGLTNGTAYYTKVIDTNTIELRTIPGGNKINLTAVGGGVGHSIRSSIDGTNDQFKITHNGVVMSTRLGKTPDNDQLFVIANGLVQNPANYTYANDIITFNQPLLAGTTVLAMYYDRVSTADSFQLDTIGDEIKTFDVATGLTPGNGYTDGTYSNIPLKNKLGSGSGATADITVSGQKVTNVVLNTAGNGYTENDVVGLSEIGEQLTNNYAPSASTYTPSTGVLELTIGSHSMLAPTTHTAGNSSTYDPSSGYLVIELTAHGFQNGDKVKLDDGAISFSCTHGGGGTTAYPRSTDPISDKWVPIFDVTANTFTIQVLDTVPSTNTTAHTWQASATDAIKHARSYIRIANNALIFSCTEAAGNHTYPRSTDPHGNLSDIPVDAVTGTTITVNALNGTTATNTTTHTFQGLSTYQFQPTKIKYIPAVGDMIVTVAGHGMNKGDRVLFSTDSLTFTCSKDNHTSDHTYPRVADPSGGAWLTISSVTTNAFTVNVGISDRFAFTPTDASYNAATGDMTLDIGSHLLLAPLSHTATDATYTPADGKVVIEVVGHGMSNGDRVQIVDGSLTFKCDYGVGSAHTWVGGTSSNAITITAGQTQKDVTSATYDPGTGLCVMEIGSHSFTTSDTVTIGANKLSFTCTADSNTATKTYPRVGDPAYGTAIAIDAVGATTITCDVGVVSGNVSTAYPRVGDPISGEFVEIFDVTNDTFSIICLDTIPSTNNSTHTFVSAVASGIKQARDFVTVDENGLIFTCEMDDRATKHSYPRKSDPAYNSPLAVKAVSGDVITVFVGKSPIVNYTPTGATYEPTTGVMELTIGSHSIVAGQSIKLAEGGVTFSCAQDGNTANKAYPRSLTDGFDVTAANYNPDNGTMTVTSTSHGMANGDWIKFKPESLTFTCDLDGNNKSKQYPRSTDYANDRWLKVSNVTTDTFDVVVLDTIPSTNTDNHTFSALAKLSPETASYDPTTGVMSITNKQLTVSAATYDPASGEMVLNVGTHGLTTLDSIRIDTESLNFSCEYNGLTQTKAYPRAANDYVNNVDIPITAYTPTTITVNVNGGQGAISHAVPHTFISATANGVKVCHGLSNGDFVKIKDESLVFSCTQGLGNKSYPRASNATYTAGAGTTYDPNTGLMVVTTTANHVIQVGDFIKFNDGAVSFSCTAGSFTHTYTGGTVANAVKVNTDSNTMKSVTAATYTPANGQIELTIGSHSYTTSDTVTITANSLSFTCDEDSHATTHTYPRLTDPAYEAILPIIAETATTITVAVGTAQTTAATAYPRTGDYASGNWLEVYSRTANTFTVKVLDSIPSTNIAPHTWTAGATDAITLKDKASGTFLPVSNVTFNTFEVNVLNVTPSTNTTTHSFVSAEANSITIAPFEKKRDPFFDTSLEVIATTATTISVDVLTTTQSTNTYAHTYVSALSNAVITGGNYTHKFVTANAGAIKTGDRHTFVSASANSVTRGIVTNGVFAYNKLADAGRLIRDNLSFIATTAYGRMIASNGSFVVPSYSKCIRDTRLICDAVADNIEFGGNDATYDAATYYVSTVHLTGEEDQSVQVFNHARDICREVMRNITVTTNSNTLGSQVKDLTITNESGNTTYDTNDCQDVASSITTLFAIVTTAVGTTAGGSGNLNSITRTTSGAPNFQVKVGTVTFDGTDTTFTAKVGGSTQVLPASDNFLIFLNSTLQVKGSTDSYTYTGSTLTFNEAPIPGMDFYGFYFGKLELIDDLAPYFDNSKKNFTMKKDNEPISLESDNAAVIASNNLVMFINGVFQEPQSAYNLRGSIIEFSEPPRAGSECTAFIFTGSSDDVLVSNTYNSVDPGDRMQVVSEGDDRLIATVSSSTSIDSYEYTGLRPTPAEFLATIVSGKVTQVQITSPGSNYENPPILLFEGGGGEGAFAQTTIEEGSGKVLSVINLQGGNNYATVPTVIPTHPLHLERKERNRIVSDSNLLGNSFLTTTVTDTGTTLNLKNVWYDVSQKYGFPDEAEVLIPFYNTVKQHWTAERILYGAKNTSANTLTVATGGRGFMGTTAHAHTILTGTYTSTGTACTVTVGAAHNLITGMYWYLDFTSGTGFDGSYKVTVTGATTFTVEFPFSRTTSGNVSLLPEVRLRSL